MEEPCDICIEFSQWICAEQYRKGIRRVKIEKGKAD